MNEVYLQILLVDLNMNEVKAKANLVDFQFLVSTTLQHFLQLFKKYKCDIFLVLLVIQKVLQNINM